MKVRTRGTYFCHHDHLRVIQPECFKLNDLVSAGILGLLDAIEKFDPNRGVKFKTYAELRIKGAILDSLRNLDWAPRSLRKKSKDLERVYRELEQRLGRPASDKEVCEAMEITRPACLRPCAG